MKNRDTETERYSSAEAKCNPQRMDKKESTKNTNIKIKWFLFHFSSASTPLKSILAVNQISVAFVSLPLFIFLENSAWYYSKLTTTKNE